jgi:tetratricopeptide (TPR) repeat protein
MTRTTLTVLALLLAGGAAVLTASLLGVHALLALPAVPLTWYLLAWSARAVHRVWVNWNLGREARRGAGPFVRALTAWAALPKVSSGESWFTTGTVPAPALERAVLFPGAGGHEEESVMKDLNAATAASRRALVTGLRELEDQAVSAMGSPLHPLFPEAGEILAVLGHAPPRVLARRRARSEWRLRRPCVDPDSAELAICIRLLVAGLPAASLAALGAARVDERSHQLRRFARFVVLMRRGEALRVEEYSAWAPELVLLAGRDIPDLVPGSPFLDAVPGGAAELERILRSAPEVVADLASLASNVVELGPLVHQVLTRILEHCRAVPVRSFLERGTPDDALTLHLRGLALLDERRPREAQAEFEAALGRVPQFPAAAYSLAAARRSLGEGDAARRVLSADAHRFAGDVALQLLYARYLAEDDDVEEARAVFERTLRRFPRSIALRMSYAQALSEWGHENDAAQQLEAAHGEHPTDARVALWVGRSRVHRGRAKDAVPPLSLAAERLRGPERAEAMYWLLAAYREQGSHEEALALAVRLVPRLCAGQASMLEEVAEYLEERHEFVRARAAAERARRLRGEDWT